MSYKVAVKVRGEPQWNYNAQRFATKGEAKAAGNDLMGRWMAAESFEVQESEDPVNYKWENGRDVRIGEAAPVIDTDESPETTPLDTADEATSELPLETALDEPVVPIEPPKRTKRAVKPESKRKAATFGDGSSMQGLF